MRFRIKMIAFSVQVMALVTLWSGDARGASGTWIGTEDSCWTNSANWSVSPYPSGADTASFTNAGNGRTVIDVGGLSGVKTVSFDTADVGSYTVGSGGANVQTFTVAADGQVSLSSTAAADQTFAAALQVPGNYTFVNSNPSRTLTFNNVTGTTVNKSLNINGSGDISILGNLSRGGNTLSVNDNSPGTFTLAGADNQITTLALNGAGGVINLAEGSLTTFNNAGSVNLSASQNTTINGPGAIILSTGGGENYSDNSAVNGKTLTVNAKLTGATGFEYWHGSNFGTIALHGQNDFTLNVIMNAAGTISVTNVGNQASTTSNLGGGTKVIFNSSAGGASALKYTGAGEDSNRILEFRKSGIVDQSGSSGHLKFTSNVLSSGGLTVTLQGSSAATGEIAGAIPNSTSVAKSGTGAWFLTASNTYSGATIINAGSLVVSGTNGAVKSTSGITLNGGSLVLLNSAEMNNADRLADTVGVTLNGGALCFTNDQTAANFGEAVGALTVNSGANTIIAAPAVEGQTSALTFASIYHMGGATVDFTGEGLGDSDRNRIIIAGQSDGLIGTWATVNGTRYAAYSSTRGVYAAPEAVDIAARGYSVITNDATLAVRISLPGETGPITLETSPVSSTGSLIQDSDTPAVVITTNTLFKLSEIIVAAGKASLTVGTEPREGTLSVLSPGTSLSLENNSADGVLTVNASIVSNTTACGLNKSGVGKVVLAGENTFAGPAAVNGGELVFGSGNHAIGLTAVGSASFSLTNVAATHVYIPTNAYFGNNAGDFGRLIMGGNCAWAGYLYPKYAGQPMLVIGNSGRGVLTIQDNASVTQRLYVGNANGSAGAVYQNGGVMHNWGGSGSDPRIGMTGYGYYELNSGTFTNMGYTQLGRDYTGIGILKQSGGAFQMGSVYDGQLGISRGGTGVVYTVGGTFNTSSGVNVGESSDNSTIRGYAEFSIDGAASVDINGNIYMADRNDMFATVNFNGGTLAANAITRGVRSGALAFVNFDGGTFRARASGNLFGTGTAAPDAVTVYGGGATFDTANLVCIIPVPLQAPTGKGVTVIGVTPRDGYIGPPMVTISGGGGTGATAVAVFDSASGTVTGIEVTSHGFGYTTTPTVSLSGGGASIQATLGSVTLGANESGGLTKIGTGTLTLSATNTYAGATIVSNGVLRVAMAQAVPTNSTLTLAGGSLDLGNLSYTHGLLNVTGSGAILNGSLACGSVVQSGGGTFGVGAALNSSEPIRVDEGVLQITTVQPGLYEGPLGGSFNRTDDMSTNILIQLTTRMANVNTKPPWSDNITYLYKGYLWNRSETNETWTFGENVDDSTLLVIDGTTLINGGNGWNVPTIGSMTLTPGAHVFEARFGNGGGGAGVVDGRSTGSASSWWKTNAFGFGVDYLGRNETNIANYVALVDPGDGRLLTRNLVTGGYTNRINVAASIELGASGILDLGTNVQSQTLANLGGSGVVSNGVLAVTGAITPGGTGSIGTLTVANSAGLSGKLLVDVSTDGSGDCLVIEGDMDLSGLSLEIANPGELDTFKIYTVATISGTATGAFATVTVPDERWHVCYRSDGTVLLIFAQGTLIRVR